MDPISYTVDGIAVFSVQQVEVFGCPSYYGHEFFQVIQTNTCIHYVTDYNMELGLIKARPTHRYIREERFTTILSQLMCMSINVSKRIIVSDRWLDMLDEVAEIEDDFWIKTRTVLKKHNFNNYYNRIPGIIALAKGLTAPTSGNKFKAIMRDFKKMDKHFNKFKSSLVYFPSLRFVALALMKEHGVETKFEIPLAITKSKIKQLEKTFDDLWFYINTN